MKAVEEDEANGSAYQYTLTLVIPSFCQNTVTKGTPASTSRRACNTAWPWTFIPYRSRTATGSRVRSNASSALRLDSRSNARS